MGDDAVYSLFLYREHSGENEKIPSGDFKSLFEIEKCETQPEKGSSHVLKIGEEDYLVCVFLDDLSEADQMKVMQAVIDALIVLD